MEAPRRGRQGCSLLLGLGSALLRDLSVPRVLAQEAGFLSLP